MLSVSKTFAATPNKNNGMPSSAAAMTIAAQTREHVHPSKSS
jgi:hypothetical protein